VGAVDRAKDLPLWAKWLFGIVTAVGVAAGVYSAFFNHAGPTSAVTTRPTEPPITTGSRGTTTVPPPPQANIAATFTGFSVSPGDQFLTVSMNLSNLAPASSGPPTITVGIEHGTPAFDPNATRLRVTAVTAEGASCHTAADVANCSGIPASLTLTYMRDPLFSLVWPAITVNGARNSRDACTFAVNEFLEKLETTAGNC
jgi:hypothetical protein